VEDQQRNFATMIGAHPKHSFALGRTPKFAIWDKSAVDEAKGLQRPLPDEALRIVMPPSKD
jgi:hypothetical protein